jgi:hypothetical protein
VASDARTPPSGWLEVGRSRNQAPERPRAVPAGDLRHRRLGGGRGHSWRPSNRPACAPDQTSVPVGEERSATYLSHFGRKQRLTADPTATPALTDCSIRDGAATRPPLPDCYFRTQAVTPPPSTPTFGASASRPRSVFGEDRLVAATPRGACRLSASSRVDAEVLGNTSETVTLDGPACRCSRHVTFEVGARSRRTAPRRSGRRTVGRSPASPPLAAPLRSSRKRPVLPSQP